MLTSIQREALLHYRAMRHKEFNVRNVAWAALPIFLVYLVLFVFAASLHPLLPTTSVFLQGVIAGVAGYKLHHIVQVSRRASLLPQIIDWPKVDRLIEETSPL